MPFDPIQFRQLLGRFATGVTVITANHNNEKHGMTANAFTSVSLNPPLILVSIDKRANMHDIMMEHDSFCVNFLSENRREWSDWWAGKAPKDADQFANIPHTDSTTGSPVLEGCLGYIDCKVWERYPAGDHTLVLGEVQDAAVNTNPAIKPLLFFASKYHQLGDPL
jgi:flavin reductase (DIM6/NTAB) family NADH-FMN oxidoreductase RutF